MCSPVLSVPSFMLPNFSNVKIVQVSKRDHKPESSKPLDLPLWGTFAQKINKYELHYHICLQYVLQYKTKKQVHVMFTIVGYKQN